MYPISEQISRNLLATLAGVTTDDGFQVTLKAIRAVRPPPAPQVLTAILYEGDDVEADGPIGYQTWRRPYGVLIFPPASESNTEPYDVILNVARADVEKAIMADPTQGRLARNTFILAPVKMDADNEPIAVVVNFDVEYRHLFNDPYRQG